MRVRFGAWLPDQPDLDNPGATVAKNVIPYAQAYGQLKSLSSFSGALTSATAALQAIWAKDDQGNYYNHAGTATRLEELQSDSTWSNVSKAGNYSNVAGWEWTKSGNRLIAVDINNATQYFDLGTSSLYADLSGSPPKAKHIASVRNFVVMGNIDDGTDYPIRLAWSGYNNTELWTPSRSTQSDVRDLTGRGGDIQRIVPGQYGVIFQENSIWVMQYSGPPTIFTLDEVEKGRGTPAPNSVCWTGNAVYYLGNDGFYRFQNGSTPIGAEKVDRWFFNECDLSVIDETRGAVDARNKLILWTFKSSSSLAYFDRILIYNWAADRWSYGEMDTEVISDYVSTGLSLDDLDTVLTDVDAESIPVDSDAYQGGAVSLAAFDSSHQLATFQGAALTAQLETVELGESQQVYAKSVRPLVSGSTASVTLANGTRNSQAANYSFSSAKAPNSIGVANFRTPARYHRIRANISGGFENAIGVDVEVAPGGGR